MRVLDRWVGPPLCAALTAVRRTTDRFRRAPSGPPTRILILKPAEQGATVVAYDALVEATRLVGPENVHLLVFSENRGIVDQLGLLPAANVLTLETAGLRRFVIDLVETVRTIRRLGFDATVDFESYSRLTAAIAYLSGARRRVGLHSFHGEGPYRGDLLTHRVAGNPHLHASAGFRALVDALGLEGGTLPAIPTPTRAPAPPPCTEPSATEILEITGMLGRAFGGSVSGPIVVLNPNAGDLLPLRRWPLDRYCELAQRLIASHPELHVVVTGGRGEVRPATTLERAVASKRCRSIAGETTLRQLLVLYCRAAVLVTNDSGPAHYAALTPIDVVTLFGPETPAVFGSLSPRSRTLTASLPCSPCVNVFNGRQTTCTDNRCMQAITVDQVFGVVSELLAQRATVAVSSTPATPRS